jgi:NO-binding membrane sensor protein with MHYT domain/nitrogen-specific signal transduction histidine kinase
MGIGNILAAHYDRPLVALSIAIAIITSAASLSVAGRIAPATGWLRLAWIATAGIAMGGGIWAMHFIAMLAFDLPVTIGYDVPTTLASLGLAVLVTSAAFGVVCTREVRFGSLATGGIIMGLGVACMHYLGMAAIVASVTMIYRPGLVLLSMLIAVIASTGALWLAVRASHLIWRLAASVVMGLAVASMHYVGMAAICFTAAPRPPTFRGDIFNNGTLALLVATGTLIALLVALAAAMIDHRFAQRQREIAASQAATARAEAALAALKAMQQNLIQAEKMASLSRFTAGVAHEINTPIGTGLTAATVLQRHTSDFVKAVESGTVTRSAALRYAAVAGESCALIVSNIQRAAELIQSFKQVAVDQTSGVRRSFDLDAYLHEVVHSLSPRLRRTAHHVAIDCPAGLRLFNDPGAISQILTNLLMNSLVHGYPDGRPGTLSVQARKLPGETVELVYGDDGSGIREADLKHVFDPFFTTKRAGGGTGLGLHIVYNIVTQTLKGSIQVESIPGATRFRMHFPISLPVPEEEAA